MCLALSCPLRFPCLVSDSSCLRKVVEFLHFSVMSRIISKSVVQVFVEAEDFTPAEAMCLFVNFAESEVLKERAKQKKDE